jgi:hypothetical protein
MIPIAAGSAAALPPILPKAEIMGGPDKPGHDKL